MSPFRHLTGKAPLAAMACIVACHAVSSAVLLGQFELTKFIFDRLLLTSDPWLLAHILLICAALTLLSALSFSLSAVAGNRLHMELAHRFRMRLLGRIMGFKYGYFTWKPTGEIVKGLIEDADLASAVPGSLLRTLCSLAGLGLVLALIWKISPTVLWINLGLAAAYFGWMILWRASVRRTEDAIGREYAGLHGWFWETLSGIKEVKLLSLEGRVDREVASRQENLGGLFARNVFSHSMMWKFSLIFPWAAFLAILKLRVVDHAAAEISMGLLVSLLNFVWRVTEPLNTLVEFILVAQRGASASGRIDHLLARGQAEEAGSRPFPGLAEGIRVTGLSFSFEGAPPILDGVDMHIPRGSRIAVVGGSGSGKSTFLHLLLRLHDGYGGSIALDGAELGELRVPELRGSIAFVSQEILLFHGTLRDNVDLRGTLSDAEVLAILEACELSRLVAALPDGLREVLVDGGRNLSGGERQRLAIARALARGAPIMVFDEATSSLDPDTEVRILEAIHARDRARTIINVTHRLAVARAMDRVYVLEGGRVVEHGPPEALLVPGGRMRSLFQEGP